MINLSQGHCLLPKCLLSAVYVSLSLLYLLTYVVGIKGKFVYIMSVNPHNSEGSRYEGPLAEDTENHKTYINRSAVNAFSALAPHTRQPVSLY